MTVNGNKKCDFKFVGKPRNINYDKTIKSIPFLRTNKDTWDFASNIDPKANFGIPSKRNVKCVISTIGSSRDGKSTFLNVLTDHIYDKEKISPRPYEPFLAKQSDKAVTNGIDYLYAGDDYLLCDIQGFALGDSKFEHYLVLMAYLISNCIILTVRQRLDIQVLNNMLSLFSFISDVEKEYRRKDRPILIIRIKDFQNISELKKNPNYLNELVDSWLEKSGDQYDRIKDAFKQTFNIIPIATLTPKYDEDNEDEQILDVYSDTFADKNPSFIKAVETVYELCQNKEPSPLLEEYKLKELVNDLKINNNIDFKKLDLYHRITECEIRKYIQNVLKKTGSVHLDGMIIDKMDGSLRSYDMAMEREKLVEKLYDDTYNVKFKEVSKEIKDEFMKEEFTSYREMYENAKSINICLAEGTIESHWTLFDNKYKVNFSDDLVSGVMSIFEKKKKILMKKLAGLDKNVREKYEIKLENEKNELTEKQNKITEMNKEHVVRVNRLIDDLRLDDKIKEYISFKIGLFDLENFGYNTNINCISSDVVKHVCNIIDDIIIDNNVLYCIGPKKEILNCGKMLFDVDGAIECRTLCIKNRKADKSLNKLINDTIEDHLTNKIGFLKNVDGELFQRINFVKFGFVNCEYVVTEKFYIKLMPILEEFVKSECYVKISENSNDNNCVKKIDYGLVVQNEHTPNMKKHMMLEVANRKLVEYLMKFCAKNNYIIV